MRWTVGVLGSVFLAGFCFAAGEDIVDPAKKIIGVWDVTKSDSLPKGAKGSVEFTKDGKIKLSMSFGEKTMTVAGTYKIKDKSVTTTIEFGGKSKVETHKLKKLTDKVLIVEDEEGKVDEYKRKGSTLKPFTSKEGRFTIKLPSEPMEQGKGALKMFLINQGGRVIMVAYQDIPQLADADAEKIKKSLQGGQQGALKSLKTGKLLSSKEVKLGDVPGLEFQIEIPGKGIYRSRLYQAKERLYQITAMGPADYATSPTVTEVIESMELKE
jgi:uncharacterized protein (TIGR03066 family)